MGVLEIILSKQTNKKGPTANLDFDKVFKVADQLLEKASKNERYNGTRNR